MLIQSFPKDYLTVDFVIKAFANLKDDVLLNIALARAIPKSVIRDFVW